MPAAICPSAAPAGGDLSVSAAQGKDPRHSRFMAYISLFATGMLGLVVSNSLLTFFVFWEIMGLCSYLLIGFWYEKPTARAAAVKAFITTRIGDAIMLMGMLLLYAQSEPSSLAFRDILSPENLQQLAERMVTVPVFNVTVPWIALIGFLIFFGTVGKSSQFPLHVWLPDAMEGPTPVSALIHAATMVSAGVFLLVRMFPLYAVGGEASPGLLQFVAFIGAFTALFASTIAVAQWDISACWPIRPSASLAIWWLPSASAHTGGAVPSDYARFFKALLFLGSGSVIHGVEHGFHHAHEHGHEEGHDEAHGEHARRCGATGRTARPAGPAGHAQHGRPAESHARHKLDLHHRRPGPKRLPLLTAGFWSKDEIFAYAWGSGHNLVFWVLAISAFITAFYTARRSV